MQKKSQIKIESSKPEPLTIGDLLRLADDVPADQVIGAIVGHAEHIDKLRRADIQPYSAAMIAELVIVGGLCARALFDQFGGMPENSVGVAELRPPIRLQSAPPRSRRS